jgi:iron-sulfur cluster assembly accessory protein
MLNLTDSAVTKVKQLMAADNKGGHALRVAVKGGGCSGFEYGLTFEEAKRDNDLELEFNGLKVYVDALSNMYLDGVRIDYLDTLQYSGFKIDNPKATGTCGCGHSFSM